MFKVLKQQTNTAKHITKYSYGAGELLLSRQRAWFGLSIAPHIALPQELGFKEILGKAEHRKYCEGLSRDATQLTAWLCCAARAPWNRVSNRNPTVNHIYSFSTATVSARFIPLPISVLHRQPSNRSRRRDKTSAPSGAVLNEGPGYSPT